MRSLLSLGALLALPGIVMAQTSSSGSPADNNFTVLAQPLMMPSAILEPTAIPDTPPGSQSATSTVPAKSAAIPDKFLADNITFDYPKNTRISDQYAAEGVIFGGSGAQIQLDAASPTSPVLTGTPKFEGDITVTFVEPGTTNPASVYMAVVDIGHLDEIGSAKIEFLGPQGEIIFAPTNNRTGFLRYGAYGGNIGIASIRFSASASEPEGYGIDNLQFTIPGMNDIGREMGISVCSLGNPVNHAVGNKYQVETDYEGSRPFPLSVTRTYNSISGSWQFFPEIDFSAGSTDSRLIRPDGKQLTYVSYGPSWIPTSTDVTGTLSTILPGGDSTAGWRYTTLDDQLEVYDVAGRITSVSNRAGISHSYTYSSSDITVTHSLGGSIVYTIDTNGRIKAFTDPDGYEYTYDYTNAGLISSVTYPDSDASRLYHYENTSYPDLLTGITDANGDRFATWVYDTNRRAISSEHNGGAERVTFDYTYTDHPNYPQTRVTNALGKDSTYKYIEVNGFRKTFKVEGHASPNCVAANQSYGFNADAFIASKTDWKGNLTTYIRDGLGRELSRTEAAGSPQERTITTEWHSAFNLPHTNNATGKKNHLQLRQ